jgi:hypothetical protein
MSVVLRERLETIADDMPPPRLADDLWLRGRRLRRRARAIAVGCAVVIVLLAAVAAPGWPYVLPDRPLQPGDAPESVPGRVYLPLWPFHAQVRDAPPGPAALMYQTGSGRRGGMVVGRNGEHRFETTSGTDDVGYLARLSPDGRYLATDGGIIDLTTGRRIRFRGNRLVWSPDGTLLSTFVDPGRVALTNPATGVSHELETGGPVRYAAFSPDGRSVVLFVIEIDSIRTGSLVALDVSDGRVIWRVSTSAPPYGTATTLAGPAAWTPDGRIALLDYSHCTDTCDLRAKLRYIDAQTGTELPGTPIDLAGTGLPRLIATRPGEGLVVVVHERTHPVVVLVRPDGTRVTLLDPPREITGIDIPRRLAEAGQFGGPSRRPAPWPVDPRLWILIGVVLVMLTPWRRLIWRGTVRTPPPTTRPRRISRLVR